MPKNIISEIKQGQESGYQRSLMKRNQDFNLFLHNR
jgi:hypothetical protein